MTCIRLTALLLTFVWFMAASASDIRTVKAEIVYIAPSNMSVDEAKLQAVERAKIEAIAAEFGTAIAQANTTFITNKSGKSETDFSNIGLSQVYGEWLETTEGPFFTKIEIIQGGSIQINCKIEGRARRLGYKADFQAIPLRNSPSIRHHSHEFVHGDDLFLYFKSPQNGFINVFLIDNTVDCVYCLLPDKESPEGAVPVKKDTEYVFFNNDKYSFITTTQKEEEFNDIVIIFSPNKFDKAYIDNIFNGIQLLNRAKFNKWLTEIRVKDPSLNIHFETIKIKREVSL